MTEPEHLLLARDHPRPGLLRALARGEVERLRRGAYRTVPAGERPSRDHDRRRALEVATALHHQLRAPHHLSHETAALVWGCALWRAPSRTHVIQDYRASGHAASDVARHYLQVPDRQLTVHDGLPVTTLARTVADCALTMHPLEALVVADSALRVDPSLDLVEVRHVLATTRTRNGRRRAAWVLEHADRGADSPWETWLRYVCLRGGLPRPTTQAPVDTARGRYRCDLGWPRWSVFAEFDGRVKYRDDGVRQGHDGAAELLREKDRYEAIREAGHDPVRVLATGSRGVPGVVARIAARFPEEVRRTFRVNSLLPAPS